MGPLPQTGVLQDMEETDAGKKDRRELAQWQIDDFPSLMVGEGVTKGTGRAGGDVGHQSFFAVVDGGQKEPFGLGPGGIEKRIGPDVDHSKGGVT